MTSCLIPLDKFRGGNVVLIGDSNAGQFTEGFVLAANGAGFDANVAARDSCPFVMDVTLVDYESGVGQEQHDCREFVEASMAALTEVPPYAVVIGGAIEAYIGSPRWGIRALDGTVHRTPDAKARVMEDALARTVDTLDGAGINVVLVAPVPKFGVWEPNEQGPLRLHWGATSATRDRSEALGNRLAAMNLLRNAAGPKATILDVFDDLCPKEECATYDGTMWLYRDGGHISVTAAEMLSDRLAELW